MRQARVALSDFVKTYLEAYSITPFICFGNGGCPLTQTANDVWINGPQDAAETAF